MGDCVCSCSTGTGIQSSLKHMQMKEKYLITRGAVLLSGTLPEVHQQRQDELQQQLPVGPLKFLTLWSRA